MNTMSISKQSLFSKTFNTEEIWIKEAQKDISAFKKLYDKYYEPIYRYAYQRMDSKDDASDVTSQVFIKAMTNLKSYKFMGVPFSSWLYRIAKSETYQFLKNKSKSPTLNVNTESLILFSEEIDSTEKIENETLIKILAMLNESEIELIDMRYFEKRSYKEIGEILNQTENNVKVRTHRIIKKLKKKHS